MPNRNKCKQWFYTFPQTQMTKHEFRENLQKCHPMKNYHIVQETHKDGNLHLHAVIILKSPISKAQILKNWKLILPNDYKRLQFNPTKSPTGSLEYLSKEDKDPLESAEPVKSAQNPYNSFNQRMANQWGFRTITEFQNHMNEYRKVKQERDSEIVELIFKFEKKLNKCPRITNIPEITHMQYLRDRVNELGTDAWTKDDMTFFQKYYENYCDLL